MSKRFLAGLLLCLLTGGVVAHELQANRLTLVLRERNHLSMTFFIDYTNALHRALAPQRTFQEFVLSYSAMPAPDFEKEVQRAQSRFQSATRLSLSSGQELRIDHWSWPDPVRVQASLQERAMQMMVAPEDHPHESPEEISAEVTARQSIEGLSVRLPEEFQQVLVVSYRPTQRWVQPGAHSAKIGF